MGSVSDYVDCPQCDHPNCHREYYYRSDEEYIFCDQCGYSYKRIAIIDRKRQKKDSENRLWYKRTKDKKMIFRVYEREGYGAFDIRYKDGSGRLGHLSKSSVKNLQKLVYDFKRDVDYPNIDIRNSHLRIWDNKQKQVVQLI